MMIFQVLAVTLVSFISTETFNVESCIAEEFQLVEFTEHRWPLVASGAALARLRGVVDLRINVSADGSVYDLKVIQSHPKRVFDKVSRRAVKRWKFNKSDYSERCFDVTLKFDRPPESRLITSP
jgi:protein TonB